MTHASIYKNAEGRQRLMAYYEQYLHQLPSEFERIYVDTRHGKTHVLVGGPRDGKPVFILQGGNSLNPATLSWFSGLLKDYRIYAPDTIGHPGYSEENRMSAKDGSFSEWIEDLLDFFRIERAAFIGPSYGGGIILRLAAFQPDRIACAVLVAPAGIKMGSKTVMIQKILLPMMAFNLTSSDRQLSKIGDAMSDGSMTELDKKIIGEVFKSVRLEQDMPKLTTKKELEAYHAPTLLIAGEKDLFFPAETVIPAAVRILPNLVKCQSFEMGHFPSRFYKEQMDGVIKGFLNSHYVNGSDVEAAQKTEEGRA